MKFTAMSSLVALVALIPAVNAQIIGRCPEYHVKVFKKTSKNAKGLRGKIEKYRRKLGGNDNASNPGPLAHGHRSINWDAPAVPFKIPFDFFDKTVTRGAVFSAKENKFAVSNPVDESIKDDRFDSFVGRNIARQLERFSLKRLFAPVKDNKFDVSFNVPAKGQRATVTGFGAIFSDVDLKRETQMTYYDKRSCVIARVDVLRKSNGLSFVGITVKKHLRDRNLSPVVAKVTVKLGNKSLEGTNNNEGSVDFVANEDLIYGEPQKW